MNVATTARSYPLLRALLFVMAIGIGIAGLSLIFETSWYYTLLIGTEPVTLPTDLLLKGLGAVVLGLSYLAFITSQDPERYVGVIDAIILVLIVVVALEIFEMIRYGADGIYPNHLLLLSTIGRAILAAVLVLLRPRT